jgi:hypothetical protein
VIELRSYRRVFDLERRIYSVDRLRLNPGGVPVRGVLYLLVLICMSLIAARTPLLGSLVASVPWYLRDIALPGASATVLSAIRIEGRTFHLAAQALVRHGVGPRRLAGLRGNRAVGECWRPQEIVLLPDGSDQHMRRLRYTGPGAVLVSVQHERRGRARELGSSGLAGRGRRPVLRVSQTMPARPLEEGRVISLGRGARLLVSSSLDTDS